MKKSVLTQWWQSRTGRERALLIAACVIIAVVLYVGLLRMANESRVRLRTSVAALRVQSMQLERDAAEIEALKGAAVKNDAPGDLRTIVQEQAASAGLSGRLGRIEAPEADQLQVSFGAVGFAQWLTWISALQSRHVLLESCRVEALSSPGLVSLTATLSRPR